MKEADETARGVVFQEGLAAEPLSFRLSGAEDDRPSLLANAGLHREVQNSVTGMAFRRRRAHAIIREWQNLTPTK